MVDWNKDISTNKPTQWQYAIFVSMVVITIITWGMISIFFEQASNKNKPTDELCDICGHGIYLFTIIQDGIPIHEYCWEHLKIWAFLHPLSYFSIQKENVNYLDINSLEGCGTLFAFLGILMWASLFLTALWVLGGPVGHIMMGSNKPYTVKLPLFFYSAILSFYILIPVLSILYVG